jgi:hypothetical protein
VGSNRDTDTGSMCGEADRVQSREGEEGKGWGWGCGERASKSKGPAHNDNRIKGPKTQDTG